MRAPHRVRSWVALLTVAGGLPFAPAALGQKKPSAIDIRATTPAWILTGRATVVTLFGQDLKTESVRFEPSGFTGRVVKVGPATHKNDEEKKRGNSAVELEITVPAAAKPGYCNFTLLGKDNQIATGRIFVDVPAPEMPEKEPNDSLYHPQSLPEGNITLTGKLDREAVDVFRFEGKKGETWRFELFARRMNPANKLEAVIRLRDSRRTPLKAAVDQGGDCYIQYALPDDGAYTLEIFDGDNRSGGDLDYRLAVRRL